MPPLFTRFLADRLHSLCRLPVAEAAHGDQVESGKTAPGDFHLKVASSGGRVRVCLDQSPQLNSCRPPSTCCLRRWRGVWRSSHCRCSDWHGTGWPAWRADSPGARRERSRARRGFECRTGDAWSRGKCGHCRPRAAPRSSSSGDPAPNLRELND
jgi:hypothetical protein